MTYNVIQYDDGTRPIYHKMINQAKSMIPGDVDYMMLTYSTCLPRNKDYRAMSDVIRLKYLATQPNMIWLDTDVLIKKWPDFELEPGHPYVNDDSGSIVFCNGCTDFFSKLWEQYEADESINYVGWFQEIIYDNKKFFRFLPHGYFVHVGMSKAICAGDKFNNVATRDFKVIRDKVTGEIDIDIRF
jgi:hypothetical protein